MKRTSFANRAMRAGLACLMLAPLTLAVNCAVAASQSSEGMEEVVVTARKREERLQDIPGSAAALSESMIEDIGGIRSLRDVTDMIPGITIVEAASSDLMEPSIRGAGQSRNRASVSATGLYRNGAYFASESLGGRGLARMDTFDVQRVEVLRGPQGALYGRNALGGAINIISRRPGRERDYQLTLRGGQKDFYGGDAIVNLPINDVWSSRWSYVREVRNDGYFLNQAGEPVDVNKYKHFRFGLMARPGNGFDAYYSYDHSNQRYPSGIRQRFRPSQTDLRQTLINTPHWGDHKIDNHALILNYTVPKGVFTSVSNYRGRDIYRIEDTDFYRKNLKAATNFQLQRETLVDAGVFFQDLRYASTLGGPFEFLLGADYYKAHTRETLDDFSAGGQTIATSAYRDWKVNQDSWAIYGSVNYNLTTIPLSISAEARYARDKVEGYVLTLTPKISNVPVLDFRGSNQFSNVPWDVSLAWHFPRGDGALNEAMAYFKVGSSYREGGLNLGAGLPTDAYPTKPVYDDENSTSYEIGVKTSWFNGLMQMNASTYYVYYNDFLDTTSNGCPQLCPYLDPVTGDSLGFDANGNPITVNGAGQDGLESPTAFFIDNVGEIQSWGVEVESRFSVPVGNSGGRISGTLGWSRQMGEVTEISSSVSPSEAMIKGADLNFVRPQQAKGTVTWRQPIRGIGWLDAPVFKATFTYTHEHGGVRSISNSSVTLDGVDRLDARIGVDSAHWSVTLNGSNVLDNEYYLDRTATRFRLADPAYYYLEVSWKYL